MPGSLVFFPAKTSQWTVTFANLKHSLVVFCKTNQWATLVAWQIKLNSALKTARVHLSGDLDSIPPGFRAIGVGDTIYLLGGIHAACASQIADQKLTVYRVNRTTSQVERVSCKGNHPSELVDFVVASHETSIFIYGGKQSGFVGKRHVFRASSETFKLDLLTMRWSRVKDCFYGTMDSSRMTAAGALQAQDNSHLYVLGGHDIDGEDGDATGLMSFVRHMDLKSLEWTAIECEGRMPDPRDFYNAAVVLWNNRLYCCGPRQCHVLDMDKCSWTLLPGSLSTHGAAMVQGQWAVTSQNEEQAVMYGIVECDGPHDGEPQPTEEGLLNWKLYRVQLHVDKHKCGSSQQWTEYQRPAAEQLEASRSMQQNEYLEWQQHRLSSLKTASDNATDTTPFGWADSSTWMAGEALAMASGEDRADGALSRAVSVQLSSLPSVPLRQRSIHRGPSSTKLCTKGSVQRGGAGGDATFDGKENSQRGLSTGESRVGQRDRMDGEVKKGDRVSGGNMGDMVSGVESPGGGTDDEGKQLSGVRKMIDKLWRGSPSKGNLAEE